MDYQSWWGIMIMGDHCWWRSKIMHCCDWPRDGSDEDTGDDSKSTRTDDHKKQNHSEIEKRRRDKMNTYITELSAMVPMCHAMSRKLDKLTVLRMAVQHMKTIRGAVQSYTDGNYKPSFLSDMHLKNLIKQAAEGFLFVVGCDRGRILYVSESVSQALNYTQVITSCRNLCRSHQQPTPRKTSSRKPVNLLNRGRLWHRFHCHEPDFRITGKKYRVIQCTGYLKPWATTKIGLEDDKEGENEGDACNLSCLVAMGRVINIPLAPAAPTDPSINTTPLLFISRHAMDGKFLFVDQRATLMLAFLPQELLGTSMYEYYHRDDIAHLAESHKAALQSREPVNTKMYRFRCKDNTYVHIQSEWKSFRNPWTKEAEYMVAKNRRIMNIVVCRGRRRDDGNDRRRSIADSDGPKRLQRRSCHGRHNESSGGRCWPWWTGGLHWSSVATALIKPCSTGEVDRGKLG
ncbi:unnamed protein product [Nesidiocoris tenuis]|uniref:Cycle n=1 Tax=Nesidiocoris tenuis TaxID=355587 RepID=A0A6H5HL31_9HEMI|nr:unnamed protein product [Nesidiocoris tenuis]